MFSNSLYYASTALAILLLGLIITAGYAWLGVQSMTTSCDPAYGMCLWRGGDPISCIRSESAGFLQFQTRLMRNRQYGSCWDQAARGSALP
jgi:hypothetical protein